MLCVFSKSKELLKIYKIYFLHNFKFSGLCDAPCRLVPKGMSPLPPHLLHPWSPPMLFSLLYVFPSGCWFSSSVWWFFGNLLIFVHSPAWGSSFHGHGFRGEGQDELLTGRGAGAQSPGMGTGLSSLWLPCFPASMHLHCFNLDCALWPLLSTSGLRAVWGPNWLSYPNAAYHLVILIDI